MIILTTAMALIDRLWTTLCRPLIGLLNVLFRPDPVDGSIRKWKVLAWIVVNCAALYCVLWIADPRVKTALIAAFLLLHILLVLAGLRVMSEEKKVLEGSLAADKMTFSVFDAVNSVALLSVSITFYVLGLPALIGLIEEGGVAVLSRRPQLPHPYVANLACVLNQMPVIAPVMNAAASLTGVSENLDADIIFKGIVGNIVRLVIIATVGFVVVQAIVLRLQQASHRRALLNAVAAGHVHPEHLRGRLLRLPHALADRLHHIGASQLNASLRQRIEATLSHFGHHR